MCGPGSNTATIFRVNCPKTLEKEIKGQQHDVLCVD